MTYTSQRFDRQIASDASVDQKSLTKRRLPEMLDLVERKLEWFGLQSMQIAHVCVTDESIQIDLASREDESTCRMEIDRFTNAITRCDGLLPSGSARQ